MHAQQIIPTHPQAGGLANAALIACIEECYDCAQTCTSCADACLGEARVADLAQCIRSCLDCADVCGVAGTLATRRTGSNQLLAQQTLELCQEACRLCAEECEQHAAHMAHCAVCAEACRRCENSCLQALAENFATQH